MLEPEVVLEAVDITKIVQPSHPSHEDCPAETSNVSIEFVDVNDVNPQLDMVEEAESDNVFVQTTVEPVQLVERVETDESAEIIEIDSDSDCEVVVPVVDTIDLIKSEDDLYPTNLTTMATATPKIEKSNERTNSQISLRKVTIINANNLQVSVVNEGAINTYLQIFRSNE